MFSPWNLLIFFGLAFTLNKIATALLSLFRHVPAVHTKAPLISALFISATLLPSWWALNTLFPTLVHQEEQAPTAETRGLHYIAPKQGHELKALAYDVTFDTQRPTQAPATTTFETDYATYLFSTEGAALTGLTFKKYACMEKQPLTTAFAPSREHREQVNFFVALDTATPHTFILAHKAEQPKTFTITYRATTPEATLEKTFTIYKESNRIDMALTVTPTAGASVQPRIFLTSPYLPALGHDDSSAVLIGKNNNIIEKVDGKTVAEESCWLNPTLFGVEDRYFVNTLTNDANNFAQRAYVKATNPGMLAILEGPQINTATTWNMSFYYGPKDITCMAAVDPRLEQALEFSGFLAPVSKFLLMIMQFIYQFVGNYGVAIILLSALLRLLMVPFTGGTTKTRKNALDVKKKLAYIELKYKNDPEMLNKEKLAILKESNPLANMNSFSIMFLIINGLGFFALRKILTNSLALYQTPFLWIPDLSQADPYRLLPILFGVCFIAQMLIGQADRDYLKALPFTILAAFLIPYFMSGMAAGLLLSIVTTVALGPVITHFQKAKAS